MQIRIIKLSKLKAAAAALIFSLFTGTCAQADNLTVPDLGTAGVLGLTVQKEQQLGDFFMRTARAMMPIVDDPVLNEYLDSVGNKLLLHANNVNFPFEFFIANDPTLNASAFLGGKVRVNTGLFIYSDTEDEFASVLAHEVSHVTQRHIARFLEGQVQRTNLTLASIIGSVAMAIINPAMGAAAISTTMGVTAQSAINFTRENEYEADRIGIDLLYRSGFNPAGMTDMFRHLLSMQGNVNPAFTMLIDHPLSEVRIAEAQNRVQQLPKRNNSTNPDFDFAKARVDVRCLKHSSMEDLIAVLKESGRSSNYQNYALALAYHELKDYAAARSYLNKLPQHNLFVIDLLTDIDLAGKNYSAAISRLRAELNSKPHNRVINLNLANAYLEAGQPRKAVTQLQKFMDRNPNDVLALDLLSTAYGRLQDQCSLWQTRGELFALHANYGKSIYMLNQALETCSGKLTQERIKARVVQIANQRAFDEALSKSL